jgi:hypothetical protein
LISEREKQGTGLLSSFLFLFFFLQCSVGGGLFCIFKVMSDWLLWKIILHYNESRMKHFNSHVYSSLMLVVTMSRILLCIWISIIQISNQESKRTSPNNVKSTTDSLLKKWGRWIQTKKILSSLTHDNFLCGAIDHD